MKSQISSISLNKLKRNLPKGGLTIIAERLNVSQSLVSRVFSGEIINEKVINEALIIIEELKAKNEEFEKRINALS